MLTGTHSAARALLTTRVTIDSLPEDALLEIFDAYRQVMELLPHYETIWNSRNGWFKLTHVCSRWRRLVHLSPTRLHVHLLFSPRRSSRVFMLKSLPPFPILVNYHIIYWTETQESLALAALRYRSRVRGIVLQRSYPNMVKLLRSLSHPFPELESLEISPSFPDLDGLLILPTTFLSGSAPRLRRLTLRQVAPASLSQFLSFATGLVKLTLTFHTHYGFPSAASLLSNLERLSCLRHLELDLINRFGATISDPPPPPAGARDVPLSKLTRIIFKGHRLYLQALVAGLVAPSLRYLDAELSGPALSLFPIPHLCKFIRDTGCHFTAIHLIFMRSTLQLYARTDFQSVGKHPFRIVIPEPVSLGQMGQELSRPLSTVEELVITFGELWEFDPRSTDQWHGLFYHVPQVKVVQVPGKVALDVARSFQQDGRGPAMDLLPALERVEVNMNELIPITQSSSDRHASIRDAFEPLIAARKQLGRPILLSLND